ncbi:hypothetical protein AB6A40_001258 [Gnathostoma spinigerum]|uniref:Trafficking protein particle complex subunit 13 n=1 Tax=Gnathostoma spinigerum TaxID=75299 RepID=A0ABD6E3R0_9BILA
MVDSMRDQLLSLKVMRLARPKFHENICLSIDPADEIGQLIGSQICRMNGQEAMDIPVGQFLMVPQVFDNIYLGETFTFYVCVQNVSSLSAMDICVKTDMQTSKQRVSLSSNMQDAHFSLEPGQSFGHIINQEIKEIGQHILVCTVTYTTPKMEKMVFRKFFKFPVLKPIDVRTKFYNAEDNLNNDVYLEAQIENTSNAPMVLEKVSLEPSEYYTAHEIACPQNDAGQLSCDCYLKPKDVQQYLYCLRPKVQDYSLKYYRGGISIGKLDMVWRSSMGERGHLQTNSLERMAPGCGDLRLTVETIPGSVKIQETFRLICRLHNCSEQSLDLILSLHGSLQPSLIFCCTSGVRLGQISPNGFVDFPLDFLPIASGLQSVSGIRVTDAFRKRTYEFDDIAQVFVA